MMRIIVRCLLVILWSANHVAAQAIYVSDSSHVSFFSETPIENIEAVNEIGTSILNVAKSEIVFRIPMNGFQFENSLMQEHFNENYMETEKFPHATFKGKFKDSLDVSIDTLYNISTTGIMTVHGTDHAGIYAGTIETKEGVVFLNCNFSVLLKDHNIKVPRVVVTSIAEEIAVKLFFRYKPFEEE